MIDNIVIYIIAYYLRLINFFCDYDLSKLPIFIRKIRSIVLENINLKILFRK